MQGKKIWLFESPFSPLAPFQSPFLYSPANPECRRFWLRPPGLYSLAANFGFQVQCAFSWYDSFVQWINRKDCCGPEMGLVTVYWPFTTTGAAELVLQTAGETRLVVDCNV